MVFFGLNFSGKKIPMKMNNMSHVWQSLEGFCVHQGNFMSNKAKRKRKTDTPQVMVLFMPYYHSDVTVCVYNSHHQVTDCDSRRFQMKCNPTSRVQE